MGEILPVVFIALAGSCLVLVLYSLWQSLRLLLQAQGRLRVAGEVALPERETLLEEKQTLLQAIKDLEFERDVGKLSDADFDALDGRYRQRARQVLHELDAQVGPYLEQARALIAGRLGAPEPTEAADVAGDTGETGARLTHACGADNEPDAVFCKKCGERLREEA